MHRGESVHLPQGVYQTMGRNDGLRRVLSHLQQLADACIRRADAAQIPVPLHDGEIQTVVRMALSVQKASTENPSSAVPFLLHLHRLVCWPSVPNGCISPWFQDQDGCSHRSRCCPPPEKRRRWQNENDPSLWTPWDVSMATDAMHPRMVDAAVLNIVDRNPNHRGV